MKTSYVPINETLLRFMFVWKSETAITNVFWFLVHYRNDQIFIWGLSVNGTVGLEPLADGLWDK